MAGLKQVTMELGSSSPVIVLREAGLDKAANAIAPACLANTGHVCISAQRIPAREAVYSDLLDSPGPHVRGLQTGNPLDDNVRVGPMVRESDATRVQEWTRDAAAEGATGRSSSMSTPTCAFRATSCSGRQSV